MKCFARAVVCSFIFVCSAAQLTKSNGDLDSKMVEQHILRLEQTVADLQSQFQAQEHKQAAVLSNLLSKLTSTSEDLENVNTRLNELEVQHNKTLLELARANEEIKNLTEVKLTSTTPAMLVQKSELASTRNDIIALQDQINSTVYLLKNDTEQVQKTLASVKQDVSKIVDVSSNNSQSLQKLSAVFREKLSNAVSFSSGLANDVHLTTSQVVRYQHVFINVGNSYDKTTGIFTCTKSGIYTFTIHGVAITADRMSLQIVHNQLPVASAYQSESSPIVGVSSTALTELTVGDTVFVKSLGNSSLSGTRTSLRNTFSGHLVSQIVHEDWL